MLSFRTNLRHDDPQIIAQIAASTGFFDNHDVQVNFDIASHLLHHQDTNHQYLFAEYDGKTVAYACFAELNDARAGTYELHWLSTHNQYRGLGIGKQLMHNLLSLLRQCGAHRLYVKTDSTEQYVPTRAFYEKCGFKLCAVLPDYYGREDNCCIYCLNLDADAMGVFDEEYAAAE